MLVGEDLLEQGLPPLPLLLVGEPTSLRVLPDHLLRGRGVLHTLQGGAGGRTRGNGRVIKSRLFASDWLEGLSFSAWFD